MPHVLKRLDARAERGFSMFLVIMTLTLTAMLVAAAFTAANGDLPVSGVAHERKSAYAAAEAGVNYYLNRVQQDPDYWTKCDTVTVSGGVNPVIQVSAGSLTASKNWRKLSDGSQREFIIELLPAKGFTRCDPKDQWSFVDREAGTFKIRVTGRARENAARTRSILATFRRDSFLNFVYYTSYENRDPSAEASESERTRQERDCSNKYRSQRVNLNCTEIQFASGDSINGPLHTNDENLYLCGAPVFGRTKDQAGNAREVTDTVEVSGGGVGWVPNPKNGACAGSVPTINTPTKAFTTKARMLDLPASNDQLASVAQTDNSLYLGVTVIRLRGDVIDVTNNGSTVTRAWPTSGVIYVKTSGSCTTETPTAAAYAIESKGCGNVHVSGTYSRPLTIAADNDVVIRPTATGADADIEEVDGSDATLGLIANNFVRVAHRVATTCGANQTPVQTNVNIEAAILALQHSFIVDNYQCGSAMGKLTVRGAIVQKYRGPVGTGTASAIATGYLKDYWYDDRFRYRSPPYFLSPVSAAWDIVRSHEVVKGS